MQSKIYDRLAVVRIVLRMQTSTNWPTTSHVAEALSLPLSRVRTIAAQLADPESNDGKPLVLYNAALDRLRATQDGMRALSAAQSKPQLDGDREQVWTANVRQGITPDGRETRVKRAATSTGSTRETGRVNRTEEKTIAEISGIPGDIQKILLEIKNGEKKICKSCVRRGRGEQSVQPIENFPVRADKPGRRSMCRDCKYQSEKERKNEREKNNQV